MPACGWAVPTTGPHGTPHLPHTTSGFLGFPESREDLGGFRKCFDFPSF